MKSHRLLIVLSLLIASAFGQLAVERSTHANDNLQAAYEIWKRDPTVAALFAARDQRDQDLNAKAAELMKRVGLDPSKYSADPDAAGKPPKPRFVLRPEPKK
jgi:hypothetical protein